MITGARGFAGLIAQNSDEIAATILRRGEETAAYLAEWGASDALQGAGVLHGLVDQGLTDVQQVDRACGERVAWLCDKHRRLLFGAADPAWIGHPPVLERVRCFTAAYCDPELAFLCVADLWRRVRTGFGGNTRLRHVAADEATQLLAPLLDMLGMFALRADLEGQLVVAEGRPFQLDEISSQAGAAIVAELSAHLPDAQLILNKYAQLHNAAGAGRGAPKLSLLPTITVLVEDEAACYRVLNQVHRLYTPVDGGVVDSLFTPNINGTRTLNVWVVAAGPNGRARVSFSIAPRDQHEINEWGLAARTMRYRLDTTTPEAWWNQAAAGFAQTALAPLGSLPEKLYVFSPKGELFPFDRGCTVVDFAYSVHSDLAEQCRSFIVNGRTVEPSTVLRHLDLVELDHDPQAPGPNRLWLHAAHTPRARMAIERYLKRQGQGSHHGQKIIEERLKVLERHYGFNLPPEKVEQAILDAVRRENLSRKEDLLAAIAAGQFAADRLFHRFFEREILRQVEIPRNVRLRHHQLHLAQCCRPRPGEDIVGRLYRRHGEFVNMTIHAAACPAIADHPDRVALKWRLQPMLGTLARIDLRAQDDGGLLGAAIAQVYARQPRITLHRVHAVARHGSARIQFDLYADLPATVQEVAQALRELPDFVITDVLSLDLPPSQQEEWMDAIGTIFNPYSRLPVNEDAMFFGRTQERARVLECLRTRQPSIWLIGQKRVGKTSLLLHLRDHELPARGFAPVFVDMQLMGHPARTNLFFEVANAVHTSLSADVRLGAVGAPLRSLFDADPARQLIEYLISVQNLLGARRLVLLIDEFSRLTDSYLLGQLDGGLFDRWRAMMHTTQRAGIGYVVVMQQQTCDTLVQHLLQKPDDPSWRLMDVGQRLQMRPLLEEDVRRLIEWPMRNHLEYAPSIVDGVATLAGGSPFLIQAFCHNLVLHMARQQRQQVTPADLETVRQEFMDPQDHTFAHVMEMLKGISNNVAGVFARLALERPDRQVSWAMLRAALPNVAADSLRVSLRTLTDQDILVQPAPDRWHFSSLLFQQWLAVNAV